MASSSTGRLYSLDEVVAYMDGMMDIPGPAADDDEWSDDDKIVEQTNLYARQYITSHDLSPRSRVHAWSREPFTREELLKFISLIIVMGLVNLLTLEDHWMTTWPYSSQTCTKVCNNNRESIQAYTGNVCSMFLACHLLYALGFLYIKIIHIHNNITTGPKTRSIQFDSQIPPPQRQHSLHSERAARS